MPFIIFKAMCAKSKKKESRRKEHGWTKTDMGEAKEVRSTSIYHRTSIKNESWRRDSRPLRNPRASRFVSKLVGS